MSIIIKKIEIEMDGLENGESAESSHSDASQCTVHNGTVVHETRCNAENHFRSQI